MTFTPLHEGWFDAMTNQTVEFPANGGTAPGYLSMPDGDGPFPGVVVIQEYWGLNDHIRDLADRFAGEGFASLAPDLYHGEVAQEPDDARKLAMHLDRAQAAKDIQGAVDYLLAQPQVEPKQAGVVGFCMGGTLALVMSYRGRNVGAVVVFYGGGPNPSDEEIAAVSAPVLGIYGSEDKGIPEEKVRDLEARLQASNKPSEFHIYEGAGHAFMNNERPAYNPDAAHDAWGRTLRWLRQHLQ